MRTRLSKIVGFGVAVAGLTLMSLPLSGQSPAAPQAPGAAQAPGAPQTPGALGTGPGGGRQGGRGGRGGDPNAPQFRTIDNVKYVDGEAAAPNSQPNPYTEVSWPQLPAGRTLGGISAIAAAPNGHIWVVDRCTPGAGACANSDLNPVWEFDADGKVIRNFGAGLFLYPHGLWVDKEGFVWVTDARGAQGKGQQVIKFSPDGKVVMRLGTAGVAGLAKETFNGPCGVVTTSSGDIFVADGHENAVSRIVKFDRTGKYLMEWGKKGTGPGEFDTPHAIALDSQGRLFVADRANSRVQVFDQTGKLLEVWRQFGRVSGLFIDANDVMYAADSESNTPRNPGFLRGIRIGSVKDGRIQSFIPYTNKEQLNAGGTHGVEGVTADAAGNVYGAFVAEATLVKYVKK
ncbi:MAG TPA: peptidyl-alpha-hydroxyglycine alpha-amidating lyase family protein [Acidimicrobiales bacterium]|nr:peptidyl-alpha-hydroxyglycine alpha-amidating lyase family protein [Acidimicrobiales bacterium]